jgi:hypothetical protein
MNHLSGNPFPSEKHELLLKASLLKGEDMMGAFRKWKAMVDFEKDIEYASFRTLPLLYFNLHNQEAHDDLMPRLKGIYRKSWSKNHLLFFKAGEVISYLQNSGVPVIIMKGIALSILVYQNHSIRPMADIDILVPFPQALKTIGLLKNAGWIMQNPHYLEFNLKYGRSVTFVDHEKTELDVHWHPIFEAHGDISEADFWDKAIPLQVAGIQTLSFCTTDIFFHTIVHGLRYNPEPPIRWIADGLALLKCTEYPLDWERLLHHTHKFKVALYMKDALNYLVREFDAPVPESFLAEIGKLKVKRIDKLIFGHAQKYGDKNPETFIEKMITVYAAYMRQTNKNGFLARHIGFVKYLRFRNQGKPFFRILLYQLSLLFKTRH